MTTTSKIKVSYNAKLFRMRVSFTHADAMLSPEPPAGILVRANERLDEAERAGEIKYRRLYKDRFHAMWKKVRETSAPTNEHEGIYQVSVAAGAPELSGLVVEPINDGKHLFQLTLPTNTQLVKPWRIEWLKIAVSTKLQELGIRGVACQAQLHGALSAAQSGRVIKQLPINPTAAPETVPEDMNQPYKLVINRAREEISLHVYDVLYFRDPNKMIELLRAIDNAANKATKGSADRYRVFDKDITTNLGLAMCGPEAVGLDLPFVQIAAATVSRKMIYHKKAAQEFTTARVYPTDHKHGWQIEWDASGMEARFKYFDTHLYAAPHAHFNIDWLQDTLRAAGIYAKVEGSIEDEFNRRVGAKQSLVNMVVARGEVGSSSSQPYLKVLFQDGLDLDLSRSQVDIRDQQQRRTVRSGQVIAEIRYKKPGKPHRDIFGKTQQIKPSETLNVKVGDGVRIDKNKFVATFAGLPEISEGEPIEIKLGKALVHQGDVNLVSGNIVFSGNVEIKGSVEPGSLIQVGGDLTIDGSVRGGKIYCGGSVTIKEGIISTGDAIIEAGGDIRADFAQNSTLVSGGSIHITKAIISCKVTAVGDIDFVNADGLILGGQILCGGSITCGRVGSPDSAAATLDIGVSPKHQLHERRLRARSVRLHKVLDDDRLAFKELSKRRMNQLTKHHQNLKDELAERTHRMANIIMRVDAKIRQASADSKAHFNKNAVLKVSGKVAANTRLHIGGEPIHISEELSGITLTPPSMVKKAS